MTGSSPYKDETTGGNKSKASKRRRRSRCHREPQKRKAPGSVPTLEDTDFRLQVAVAPKAKKQDEIRSLPVLLHQRELGLWSSSGGSVSRWQARMMSTTTDSPMTIWRPYAHRRLAFRQLQTPAYDAVLGFDESGSYIVALGGQKEGQGADRESNPPLVLRFYGKKVENVCVRSLAAEIRRLILCNEPGLCEYRDT